VNKCIDKEKYMNDNQKKLRMVLGVIWLVSGILCYFKGNYAFFLLGILIAGLFFYKAVK